MTRKKKSGAKRDDARPDGAVTQPSFSGETRPQAHATRSPVEPAQVEPAAGASAARFWSTACITACVAGVVCGVADAWWGARAAALDGGDTLRLIGALAALALVPALVVGLVQALVLGGVARAGIASRLLGLRDAPAEDRRAAAWLVAGVGAALVLGVVLAVYSPRLFTLPEDAPARQGALALRGLVLAVVALGCMGVLAFTAWTVARVLSSFFARWPEAWRRRLPLTWLALSALAVGGVGAALVILLPRRELFAGVDAGFVWWCAGLLATQGALLLVWRRLRARPWPRLLGSRRVRVAVFASVLLVALVSVAGTVLRFDEPKLLSAALGQTTLGKRVVGLWRRALDRDGDGYAALLGGGDCDDGNAAIHPGAKDVPDNGVDEDCSGADAHAPRVAATPPTPMAPKPNGTSVVLITIDTLRADHLGAYGYARPTSPKLDAFAKTGVVFERAYAAANHTPRAIPALLAGQYPSRIAWKKLTNYPPLADETRTLAHDLKAAGYKTAGVFPHWYFHKRRNLHRAFDVWDMTAAPAEDDGSAITAPAVTKRARAHLRTLAKGPSPFFLWVHYYEPHHPYVEHAGKPRFGNKMMDRYDGEIRYVDDHVGELLRALEEAGVAGQTAVVVTSDHGEAFGEHKQHWHGHALYDEQVRVPLIVRAPQLAAGRVKTPVSTVDMAPTLLDLLGLPARADLSGRSLTAVARGEAQPPRPVFVELLAYPNFPKTMRAVVLGDWKLIHDVSENRYELFDLAADPLEQRDLSTLRPAELERLRALIGKLADGSPLAALD